MSGPKAKVSHPITWTEALHTAFNEFKASLTQAAILAHQNPRAPLALVTDASNSAKGAVLQQRVEDVCQPLALFSRKLSPAQQKYSAYNREILAIYEAVSYFRHMLEARHFTILTDHKPLTFTLHQERDKCSQRQFNHLDLISQFTIHICHISGQDIIVTDALSMVEVITEPLTNEALSAAQADDDERRTLLLNATTKKILIPGTSVCDDPSITALDGRNILPISFTLL
jgi:cleavage and polyadenylation specificity factor subunit 1